MYEFLRASSVFIAIACLLLTASTDSVAADSIMITLMPAAMQRVAVVDERYQSYNVEMAEVMGGNFWRPYNKNGTVARSKPAGTSAASSGALGIGQDPSMYQMRPPIDLSNPRLRKLAAALGPAYVRVSGTWANTAYFQDADAPAPAKPPKGFQNTLTRSEWKGVIDFAQAVDAKLVTSFAISSGVRDAAGVWTPEQARRWLAYTKAIGGQIAAAEMFNEPSMPTAGGAPPGYNASSYARDFAVFQPFIRRAAPSMLIVGPGSVGEGGVFKMASVPGVQMLKTPSLLEASPRPVFDVFSYHSYAAASIRCASMGAQSQTTAGAALSEEWLSRPDAINRFYIDVRDQFKAGKGAWVTETADSACGGNPWAATFLDTFRYLDQLGRLAKRNVTVIFQNTLASSDYGLLDQNTFEPRPNYWGALLWRKLIGNIVLDARASKPGLHVYAQCQRDRPGGVSLLAINTSQTQQEFIHVPIPSERYTLTAPKLEGTDVRLNGHKLVLGAGDELPMISGERTAAGNIALAPASITFLTLSNASNPNCR